MVFGSDSASAVDFTVGGAGLSDSLTLNLGGADLLGNTGTTTFNGIEVLNINTGAPSSLAPATFDGAVKLNPTAGAGSAIVATGTNGLTLNGAVTAGSINAAALTGALVVGGTAANAIVITGGINNDFIAGSALADTLSGGAGNDTVLGRAGADAIHVGIGTDIVVQGTGDSGTYAAPVANIVSTTLFDVITGMAAGDQIDLTNVVRTVTFVSTLVGSAAADNTAVGVRGTYNATAGTFTGSETGADTLLNYDTDITAAVALEAIILVGYVNASTAASSGTGVFTLV